MISKWSVLGAWLTVPLCVALDIGDGGAVAFGYAIGFTVGSVFTARAARQGGEQ